jgi:hypothetical protein
MSGWRCYVVCSSSCNLDVERYVAAVPAVMGCLRCLSVIASDLDNEQAPQLVQVRMQPTLNF